MSYHFRHATVAGTFDHFHIGHQVLIDKAFEVAEKVSVGIATEELWKNKVLASSIEPFSKRKRTLQAFIKEKGNLKRCTFFELSTVEGIALTDKSLDSIVVTNETRPNAIKINTLRKQKGLPPLNIITIRLVKSNIRKTIRSSEIRAGKIDRKGYSYKTPFVASPKIALPESLRAELRQPFGKVMKGSEKDFSVSTLKTLAYLAKKEKTLTISVGDVVTGCLVEAGFTPDISIVDGKTKREEYKSIRVQEYKSIKGKEERREKGEDRRNWKLETGNWGMKKVFLNAPATIQRPVTKKLINAIKRSVEQSEKTVIFVKGEEDLLALPAMLLAPLGSFVLYGQFDMGIVVVEVTEEVKERVRRIVEKFNS